jgi:capsular polysaccharide biosynthesis protein
MAAGVYDNTARRIDFLGALYRHWLALLFPILLLVAGAVALGIKRPPKYTSTATVQVGHVYIANPAGVSTIIEATQTLAGVYSRAINATAVRQDVAQRLKRESVSVSGGLSATPLPSTPLIKVTAEATSATGAAALANAGADSLVNYVNHQVKASDETASLTKRYKQAALDYRQKKDLANQAERRYERRKTRANKAARDAAGADEDSALLAVQTLRGSYQQAVQGGIASAAVENFQRAPGASSDRKRTMQILVFVGLLGGIAAGVAFALLRTYRETRPRRGG